MVYFYLILIAIIAQRLLELHIASKNERWMKARGGIEVGKEHYKFFILVHVLFFLFFIIEVHMLSSDEKLPFNTSFFLLFLFAQVGRIWCILSLGRFWNTKIIILPKVVHIKKGPYKYVKHPNYIIVFMELLVIPLIFGAYVTAIVFPLLHVLLLIIRIPSEERALGRRI